MLDHSPRRSPLLSRRAVAVTAVWALVVALASVPAWAQGGPAVQVQARSFAPTEVHVPAGTAVTWTNGSQDEHTVTADDNSFDSGTVEPGDSFSRTFDAPGRYQYYCQFHGAPGLQDMAGVIVVDA